MFRWLAGRVVQALLTLVATVIIIFVLMRLTPGDPLGELTGDRIMTPEQVHHLQQLYHTNQPILTQLLAFTKGILQGDLGGSIHYGGRPVTQLLRERLPASLRLGGSVLLLNFTLGLWLGMRQAVRQGRRLDRWLTTLSLTGYAMPSFWLGSLLAWWFGVRWHILPVGGMHDPLLPEDATLLAAWIDGLRHLVLPTLTLSFVTIAATMRHQRSALLQVLQLDFVRAARTRGLTERRVVWRHAWRNALLPVLTLFGLWLPILATGSVLVEYVFAWPGVGQLAAEAIGGRDYPLIMGTALLVSTLVVLGGLLTDIAYLLLDPRIRLQE